MADIESNIHINVDTSNALANIKQLQAQISAFHQTMSKGSASTNAQLAQMQQNLVNSINKTGAFSAQLQRISTTTETFTNALEKNKLSMGQYFRYAGSQVVGMRKIFSSEFDTMEKVARERVKTLQTQYIKLGRDASGAMQSIAVRPLALDMKDLGTQSAIAAQKQQIFNQLIKQGSTNLLNFGKNTQWAGRQLMVGFSIPLGIAGAAAAREFMKIEEQVLRLQRVYGDFNTPTSEIDEMTQSLKDLSVEFTKYGLAVEKTMELAADAAAMGKQGQELLDQVTEATRLAVLGGVEQQQALETTTSLTNAFGVASDKLAGKINFLNAVENQTVTSIEDLTEAIPKAGPVVQQLGGGVEDLAFFLTAMKEGGINASEGANALKSGLASLINPTGEAAEMLASFGINVQKIVESNAGNVKGIVVEFAQALDTLDPLNRARAIEQLFGKFQFSRMSTLFQNVIAEGSQASRVLQLTNATTQELAVLSERELRKVEESPMYKFKGAIEAFQASLAPVGEAFLKAVTPIIEFGTRILDKFNEMSDGAKQFVVVATTLVAGIGPVLLMAFGLVANGVANVIKMFQVMGNLFKKVGGGSNILGQQTDYMTMQQLEAAAVASSLNQVHQSLAQTFTSEASAVQRLTTAYNEAIIAQSRMGGIGVGPGPTTGRTRKYAKGVTMVPGPKGAGDIVPAMLAPGEAVVPAEYVKKYGPLISAMVSGNIPGYVDGFDPTLPTSWAHVTERLPVSLETLMREVERAPENFTAALRNQITGMFQAFGPNFQVGAYSGLGFTQADYLNQAMRGGGAVSAQEFLTDFSGRGLTKWEKSLKMAGLTMDEVAQDLRAYDAVIETGLRDLTRLNGNATITSEQFANIERSARQTLPATSRLRGAIDGLAAGFYELRVNTTQANIADALASGTATLDGRTLRFDTGGRLSIGNDRIARTRAIGGLQLTDLQRAEQVVPTGQMRPALPAGTQSVRDIQALSQYGVPADQVTKEMRWARKAEERRQQIAAEQEKQIKANKAVTAADQENAKQAKRGLGARFKNMSVGGKAAAVGGTASGLLMAGSMLPGEVGQVAQNAMMPVMAASMIVPMLAQMGPVVGSVVAALGVVAGAGIAFATAMGDASKKARETVQALGSGNQAMQSLAEAAGTVTSSEIMNKRRQESLTPYGVQTGKTTFGQSFLEGEAGKALLENVQTALKSGTMQNVQSLIINQMSTAIATGALNAGQARSIVASLAEELGDVNFGIQVNGKLIDLIGPNGENLITDPITVRVNLMQEAQNMARQSGQAFQQQATTQFAERMRGAGALGILSPGLGIWKTAEAFINLNEQAATFNSLGVMQVQQQQQILDSLQLEYEQRMNVAKAAGDLVEAERLSAEYAEGRQKIIDKGNETVSMLVDQFAKADFNAQNALGATLGDIIDTMYKDNPLLQQAAIGAKEAIIAASGLSAEQEYQMKVYLASGNVDPMVIMGLMQEFGDEQKTMDAVVNLMSNVGTADGNRALQIANMFVDENGKPRVDLQRKFLTQFSTMGDDPEKALQYIGMFEEIAKTGEIGDFAVTMEFFLKNEEKAQEVYDQTVAMKELTKDGPIKAEMIYDIVGADVASIVKANQDYFNSLPADQQVTYTTIIRTLIEQEGTKDFDKQVNAWLKEQGIKTAGGKQATVNTRNGIKDTERARIDAYAAAQAYSVTAANTAMRAANEVVDEAVDAGAGAEPQKDPTSMLDGIIQKIKNVKNAAIGLTDTWRTSMDALMNFANTAFSGFSGIENQLRGLGAGEDAISMITGMSKEDWDKYKNELFVFDSAGNISNVTQQFQALNVALREIKLGEFFSAQQKVTNGFQYQLVAVQKLVAAGLSYSQALEVAKDAELSRAIATGASADEMARLVQVTREAEQATKNLAAAQAVANKTEETANRGQLVSRLASDTRLTDAQREAILGDSNLAQLYLNPTVAPAVLDQALADAQNAAKLELDIKKLTFTGLVSVFQDGFSKAMEAFAAREKQIELRFDIDRKPFEDMVESAQQMIADINNAPGGIDDLSAELERISNLEDEVNKKYDARLKALDKISTLNERSVRQQRAQLTIADALTRGDIAAAAAAVQDMRAQQAADSLAAERDMLAYQREAELANLTATMGLNREQIETRIKALKQQIFDLEESTLEPAQYRIELLNRQQQQEIDSLTVLGRTKDEWANIQNQVDLARTSTQEYTTAMEEALGVVTDILNHWESLDSTFTTTHQVHTVYTEEGPRPYGAPAAAGGPGGGGTDTSGGNTQTPAVIPEQQRGMLGSPSAGSNRPRARYNPAQDWPLNKAEYEASLKYWTNVRNQNTGRFGVRNTQGNLAAKKLEDLAKLKQARKWSKGGYVPAYLAEGGLADIFKASGTDTVPAMLTPGEFIVRKEMVDKYGTDLMNMINSGKLSDGAQQTTGLSNLSKDVVTPTVTDINDQLKSLGEQVDTLNKDQTAPALRGIGQSFKDVYNTVINPIINQIGLKLGLWGDRTTQLYTDKVGPTFDNISLKAFSLLNDTITPVSAQVNNELLGIGDTFTSLYADSVGPAMKGISDTTKNTWTNSLLPTLTALVDFVKTKPGEAFTEASNKIGIEWGKIKNVAKDPVRFIIETVINGLIDAVNGLGLTIKKLSLPPGFSKGGYTGNVSPSSVAGVVHGQEYVINANSRKKIEEKHPGAFDYMNQFGDLPGYRFGGFVHPLPGYPITQWSSPGHPALDIGAPAGTPIRAAAAGTVLNAGGMGTGGNGDWMAGNMVDIAHGNNLRTLYAHMIGRPPVRRGQSVKAGTNIGGVGNTGYSFGNHLHYEIWDGKKRIDPAPYIKRTAPLLPADVLKDLTDTIKQQVDTKYPKRDMWVDIPVKIAEDTAKHLSKMLTTELVDKYDNGGWLMPGRQIVENATGKPEAVLTAPQWNLMSTAVDKISSLSGNTGQDGASSVYNNTYSINVNVNSDANPDQIARAVMTQIKQVDAQRIRGNRF